MVPLLALHSVNPSSATLSLLYQSGIHPRNCSHSLTRSRKSCWKWGYNREWLKICVFVWMYVYTVCVCVSKNVGVGIQHSASAYSWSPRGLNIIVFYFFFILKFEINWRQKNCTPIVSEIPVRVEVVRKQYFGNTSLVYECSFLWIEFKVLNQLIFFAKRISCPWPFIVDGFPCDTIWLVCVDRGRKQQCRKLW